MSDLVKSYKCLIKQSNLWNKKAKLLKLKILLVRKKHTIISALLFCVFQHISSNKNAKEIAFTLSQEKKVETFYSVQLNI